MNSICRSILARSLMTGAASLALMLMAPGWVHAETVIVQGTDGAAGGVNPDGDGPSGGDGEPAAADAGSVHPITFPLNQATATGGNGGAGGNGAGVGGAGGNGGAATARAATTIVSGSAEADANSSGGNGGRGGISFGSSVDGNGGAGGDAIATSAATNADNGPVAT
jgi:hypothetical protein